MISVGTLIRDADRNMTEDRMLLEVLAQTMLKVYKGGGAFCSSLQCARTSAQFLFVESFQAFLGVCLSGFYSPLVLFISLGRASKVGWWYVGRTQLQTPLHLGTTLVRIYFNISATIEKTSLKIRLPKSASRN